MGRLEEMLKKIDNLKKLIGRELEK